MIRMLLVAALLGSVIPAAAQELPLLDRQSFPALVAGQSNAVRLSPHLPPWSHVLIARDGHSIVYFRPNDRLGLLLYPALDTYAFQVLIWWQGESDYWMTAAEYRSRLWTLMMAVNRPVMIVEIISHPDLMQIKSVHAELAQHPYVALIPTADLPAADSSHFTAESYDIVTQRLMTCFFTSCWQTQ